MAKRAIRKQRQSPEVNTRPVAENPVPDAADDPVEEQWATLKNARNSGWVEWEDGDFVAWAIQSMGHKVTALDLLQDWIDELEETYYRIQDRYQHPER